MPHRAGLGPILLAVVLVLFVVVVYLPTMDAPFTFDDYVHIVHDESAQPDHWTELSDSLTHPYAQDRPVARLTFGLNYLVADLNPTAYHATNIGIHAASALLLFALLLVLARGSPRSPSALARHALVFAFAGALLWAIHPANTQAVSYVVQRMASMAGLFYLATLLVFVLWRLRKLRLSAALTLLALFWGLALGSKPNAASAPAAWWLIEVAFFTGFTRRNIQLAGVIVAIGLASSLWVLSEDLNYLILDSPRYGFSGIERLLTETRVLLYYVSLLLWPSAERLNIDYEYTASESLFVPWSTAPATLGIVIVTVLAVMAIHHRRFLWPATGWLFFLIGSAVESSFVMLDPIFEHRIYLPSALLVSGLIAPIFTLDISQRQWMMWRLGFLIIAAIIAWQTIERNRQWARPTQLWVDALKDGAKERRARANAGIAAMQKGRLEDAANLLKSEAGTRGSNSGATVSPRTARMALVRGRFDKARTAAARALKARPASPRWAYIYGLSLVYLDRLDEARDIARQFYKRLPRAPATAILDSLIQERAGDRSAGIQRLSSWMEKHSDRNLGQRNLVRLYLANMLYRSGHARAAIEHYREIVHTDPLNWSAWVNLAQVLRASGEAERARAIEDYLRARHVEVETFRNYGQSHAAP